MPKLLESYGNHIVVDSIPVPFHGCGLIIPFNLYLWPKDKCCLGRNK
jgi:hypothetical protein